MLTTVNPLACCIDLAVRLDGPDYCSGRNLDLARLLDNALQRCAHIALPLGEKAHCMCVPVNAASVSKSVLSSHCCRASPRHKLQLDLDTIRMRANRTVAL